LAGPNGGGKSSVAGAFVRGRGSDYYNPDEVTRKMLRDDPFLEPEAANSLAWLEGKRLLEKAISGRLDFILETTLGGDTIPALLRSAADSGLALRIWFVALGSAEDHVARVKARVKQGGHDIPEVKIRQRYDNSRANLIELLPHLTELRVFDNSLEGDPAEGAQPRPMLILHLLDCAIAYLCPLPEVPNWAKPIVVQALKLFGTH
jgi:predicted ABC-type ATPase